MEITIHGNITILNPFELKNILYSIIFKYLDESLFYNFELL